MRGGLMPPGSRRYNGNVAVRYRWMCAKFGRVLQIELPLDKHAV